MTNDINIPKVSEIEISYKPVIKPSEMVKVSCSKDAENIFRHIWNHDINYRESFYALYLNRANRVLGYHLISFGGISGTVVDAKCIYQAALKASAINLILAHNHPSGNGDPSDADIKITKKLKDAGKLLDITLLDHLILLPEGYTSMAGEGLF
jgi:DNA repair protein RadC